MKQGLFTQNLIAGAALGIGAFLGAGLVTFVFRLIRTEAPFIPIPQEFQPSPQQSPLSSTSISTSRV